MNENILAAKSGEDQRGVYEMTFWEFSDAK